MHASRPSTTATWVAVLRGLSTQAYPDLVDDPLAEALVPPPYDAILRLAGRRRGALGALHAFADRVTRGRSLHMAFRTRAIDDAIVRAVEGGARQVVFLGAGLDSRAWRLDALRDVAVLEVDHPSTQEYKRERVASLPLRAARLAWVGSDFERDDLAQRLHAAGHDATVRTVFVWEGVTMYLSRDAIEATLSAARRQAAPGSAMLATYWCDHRRDGRPPDARALERLLAWAGEPIQTSFTREEVATLLGNHGFDVVGDEGDPEWSTRYRGIDRPWTLERLVRGVVAATA